MREFFKEYYPLPERDVRSLWDLAVFVFDANVLLNLYRYSDGTVASFIGVLEQIKDRIWIPFQIAYEFHQDRLAVINQQSKIYSEYIKKINEISDKFIVDCKNPFLNKEILSSFSSVLDGVISDLEVKRKGFDEKIFNDDVLIKITALFENRVGCGYCGKDLDKLYLSGNKRYVQKIPPGYQDQSKPEPNRYGDFIIWRQMIDYAKNKKTPLIFVTDDRKDDWWLINSGKTVGPRPELRREFYYETEKLFYMYPPDKFLEYAYNFFDINKKQDAIDEVKGLLPFSEEQLKSDFKNDILISVLLEKKSENDIDGYIDLLKGSGYDVYHDIIDNKKSKIYIPIPNIPDLKRRIQSRFISQVTDYGLTMLDINLQESV